jgi:hypothetical protein
MGNARSRRFQAFRHTTQNELDFLFEGVKAGSGTLSAEFTRIGTAVVTDAVNLKFASARDMYETYEIPLASGTNYGPDPAKHPDFYTNVRSVPGTFRYTDDSPETRQYVLFVHGWRMQPAEKIMFANTAYKRLFWQGYKGRFGAFDWPTEWVDTRGKLPDAAWDPQNYDRSEEKAWASAAALKNLLSTLKADYGYANVNMFAHSMGNIVASEALRQAGTTKVVHTYVASQAATVAGAYSADAPQVLFQEGHLPGNDQGWPDIYGSFPGTGAPAPYFGTINAATDVIYNFYNPLDYATSTGKKQVGWTSAQYLYLTWRGNQSLKPDRPVHGRWYTYQYNHGRWEFGRFAGQTWQPDGFLNLANPVDRYEAFSYAAQPRTLALGAQGGLHGAITGSVNLSDGPYQFSDAPWDHSAEFLNTNAVRQSYWDAMLTKFGVDHITPNP